MLLPAGQGLLPEEKSYKEDIVRSFGSDCSKIIFLLLTEIVAFHMSIFLVDVRKLSFYKSLLWLLYSIRDARILAFRTVFRIYWRSFSKYLARKNVTEDIVGLGAKSGVEDL